MNAPCLCGGEHHFETGSYMATGLRWRSETGRQAQGIGGRMDYNLSYAN